MAVGKVIGYNNYDATRLTPQQSVPFKGNEQIEEGKTEEKSSGGGKVLLTLAGLATVGIAGVLTYRHFNPKAIPEAASKVAGEALDAVGNTVKKAADEVVNLVKNESEAVGVPPKKEVLTYVNKQTSKEAMNAKFSTNLEQIKPEKRLSDGTPRAVKEKMYADLFSKKENLIYGKTIKGQEYLFELDDLGKPVKLLISTKAGSQIIERPKLIEIFIKQNSIDLNAPKVAGVVPPFTIGSSGEMLNRFGRIV